jgi:hypothetical protein
MKPAFGMLATALVSAVAAIGAQAAGPAAPKIGAIRAQLYYEETGKLSKDILSDKDLSLWNTIIGEGGSGGASNYTLVTVEVQGKDVPVGAVKVQVVARDSKRKIIAMNTADVSIYDAKTSFNAPLFLYNTGCDEIEISASLLGKGIKKNAVKAKIPFACGE